MAGDFNRLCGCVVLVGVAVVMTAIFSECRQYRYALWRRWDALGSTVVFIGLNPSTADETVDDPTIRRCVGYAKAWGYGGLCMVNLFAYRATDPAVMMAAPDPVGPENDARLRQVVLRSPMTVAAWGTHGSFMARAAQVRRMLPPLHYLSMTKSGQPGHPLYLKKTLTPRLWG